MQKRLFGPLMKAKVQSSRLSRSTDEIRAWLGGKRGANDLSFGSDGNADGNGAPAASSSSSSSSQ